MTHIFFTDDQIKNVYPVLYKEVFNEECKNKPNVVLAVPDGNNFSCYLAGYWLGNYSFYIQDAGVIPEYRLKGFLRHLKGALNSLVGVRFITMTDNQNITAMKTLLLVGFKPIGGKFIDNIYYVEWLLEAQNG